MSIHLHHLAVQLPVPTVCDMYSMKRTIHWTGTTNVLVLSFASVNHHCLLMHSVMVPHTVHVTSNLQVSAGLPRRESANGRAAGC